jgi:hypothetical protein
MQPTPQNFLWITFRASRNLDIYPTGTHQRLRSGRPGTAGGRDGTINGGILRFGV